MAKLGGEQTALLEIAQDERARAARTAQLFSEEDLTRNLQIALRTFDDLNHRLEQRFHLELGLLKLIQAQRLLPMEEILSGLATKGSLPRPSTAAPVRPTPPTSRATPAPPPQAPTLSPFAASNQRGTETPMASSGVSPNEVKGTGFSPYIKPTEAIGALAPEVSPSPIAPVSHSSSPETLGALALSEPELSEPEQQPTAIEPRETGPQIVPPIPSIAASPESPDTDPIRSSVVQALANGGHASAATLIEDGKWTIEAGNVRIDVNAGPKMIGITFNAAAEKLIRQGLSQAGAPARFMLVSAKGQIAQSSGTRIRAPLGSIENEARNHPMVVQAQSLFNAEIVTVVDLRT
jgi:DNA polymerase-3 subunit gamma/tau